MSLENILKRDDIPEEVKVIIARSISDQKSADEKINSVKNELEATLNALPDLLFEVGLDGKIYNYHTHRTDLLAFPPEVFIGKRFADVLPEDATEACESAIKEAAANGWSRGKEYSLELPAGKRWFELSVAPRKNKDKEDRRYIIIARDITERKEDQDKKNMLLQEVHHRVKNNLAMVTSLLHLQKNEVPIQQKHILDDALGRINAIGLVHQLLYGSDTFEKIKLNTYIEKFALSLKNIYANPDKKIEIQLNVDQRISLPLDESIPYALLLNELIVNSYKHAFTEASEGVIRIDITANNSGNLERIVLEDNGKGFDVAHKRKGLGMDLIEQLSKQLGGNIACESVAGVRTTYTFAKADTVKESNYRPQPHKPKSVYIVEDETIIQRDIENSLIAEGYSVFGTSLTGEGIINDLKNSDIKPGVILMDITLDGKIDGINAAEALREYNIPIIFRTGNDIGENGEETSVSKRIKGIGLNRFEIIDKNEDFSAILKIIGKYLDNKTEH